MWPPTPLTASNLGVTFVMHLFGILFKRLCEMHEIIAPVSTRAWTGTDAIRRWRVWSVLTGSFKVEFTCKSAMSVLVTHMDDGRSAAPACLSARDMSRWWTGAHPYSRGWLCHWLRLLNPWGL